MLISILIYCGSGKRKDYKSIIVLRMTVEIYNKYHIPAKRSANVRARVPFCSFNTTWLVFREDGLFLNILSIENEDAKSIGT